MHAIYIRDKPLIEIEFPAAVEVRTKLCVIEDISVTGMTGSIPQDCSIDDQTFTIRQFLPGDYIPAAQGEDPRVIKLTLGSVLNAVSVQEINGLKIIIKALENYAIDEYEGTVGWEPIQGSFAQVKVKPGSPMAYDE